jgi:hypothetical protein
MAIWLSASHLAVVHGGSWADAFLISNLITSIYLPSHFLVDEYHMSSRLLEFLASQEFPLAINVGLRDIIGSASELWSLVS